MGLSFLVRDKNDSYRRTAVGSNQSADLLWNDTSLATFTLDDDHAAAADLTEKGARCSVLLDDEELFRGRIARTPGRIALTPEGRSVGQLEFTVECDKRKFHQWQGWPKPDAPISGQDVEYAVYTGSAEKVFKDAVAANLARLGVPWTVAPNLNRGSNAKAEFRFHYLGEKLFPILATDRLGVTLEYGATVLVDLRSPNVVEGVLNLETGVVDELDFDRWAPSGTRVVVGGRNEGIDRELLQRIDADREADWNDIIEVFKDARNSEVGADRTPDAIQALAEHDSGASVSMDLVETDRFRFRTHYQVGDVVPFTLAGQPGSEVITRVTITDTESEGVQITPHIGDVNVDPIAQLGARISELKSRVRDLGRA